MKDETQMGQNWSAAVSLRRPERTRPPTSPRKNVSPLAIFDNTSWKKAQTINFLIFTEKIKFWMGRQSRDWKRVSSFITDGPISIRTVQALAQQQRLVEMLPLWYFVQGKSFSGQKWPFRVLVLCFEPHLRCPPPPHAPKKMFNLWQHRKPFGWDERRKVYLK